MGLGLSRGGRFERRSRERPMAAGCPSLAFGVSTCAAETQQDAVNGQRELGSRASSGPPTLKSEFGTELTFGRRHPTFAATAFVPERSPATGAEGMTRRRER